MNPKCSACGRRRSARLRSCGTGQMCAMNQSLSSPAAGETLLADLFSLHFDDPIEELKRFRSLLARVKLPFELLMQLRRQDFPGYPTFEYGLPSTYCYFVPGSGWGSANPPAKDPLHKNFVYSADGFGLNLGCVLRLKRALEVFDSLPDAVRLECAQGLAEPTKHLPTVEELLWLDAWLDSRCIRRSEDTQGKRHDWIVDFSGLTIRQECKLRPVDWARLVDGEQFVPMQGFLLAKAAPQLPNPPEQCAINIVTVTGIAGIDSNLDSLAAAELTQFPNVQALVFRNYPGHTAVFSLTAEIADAIHCRLISQHAPPFQLIYPIIWNRDEFERRRETYNAQTPTVRSASLPTPHKRFAKMLPPKRKYRLPVKNYRYWLADRLPSGEPVFQILTPPP
jgi:hypothetical protein